MQLITFDYCQLMSLITTKSREYWSKKSLIGSLLPFLNESTNYLVMFLNEPSIK